LQLPYAIAVDVPNNDALGEPRLNVSTEGSVPTTVQTFRVALPCSGLKDAEVNVSLSVNITLHRASNNVTALVFRRRKICLKGEYRKICLRGQYRKICLRGQYRKICLKGQYRKICLRGQYRKIFLRGQYRKEMANSPNVGVKSERSY
jgi:hypothetical protein